MDHHVYPIRSGVIWFTVYQHSKSCSNIPKVLIYDISIPAAIMESNTGRRSQ